MLIGHGASADTVHSSLGETFNYAAIVEWALIGIDCYHVSLACSVGRILPRRLFTCKAWMFHCLSLLFTYWRTNHRIWKKNIPALWSSTPKTSMFSENGNTKCCYSSWPILMLLWEHFMFLSSSFGYNAGKRQIRSYSQSPFTGASTNRE